jgi:membrane protein implicated in regulation of membrane protease activity
MDPWMLWILAAVLLAAGEVMTTSFFLAPFAAAALAAALLDAVGVGVVGQWIVFLVTGVALLGLLRPVARRHLKTGPALRTGPAALVGQTGTVVERVANDEGVGAVRINGQVWTARTYDGEAPLEAGSRVLVMEIKGATALVTAD